MSAPKKPKIYINDFDAGDYLLVEAISEDLDSAETLYKIEYISFELHVTAITHLRYTADSKFPDNDTWTGNELNSDKYKVKQLTKIENPEYFL